MNYFTYLTSCLCVLNYVATLSIQNPSVFVVTPASRVSENEGRSAPFYYHNWMRRIDSPQNATTTTTPKTPDLIFAEFESGNGNDMQKSIRRLLEKEKVQLTTTVTLPSTTLEPPKVYVTEEKSNKDELKSERDYFEMYNNLYNKSPGPVYVPVTKTTATSTITSTPPSSLSPKVENIWHIIDSEKRDQYSGKWEELPIDINNQKNNEVVKLHHPEQEEEANEDPIVLPGFQTNPGNGAENESRAIRTEPNVRFPYVNLKPFQMKKGSRKPSLSALDKKGNNMFTNLDNFKEINNPVRGESQDLLPTRAAMDRYNPAQPYLPPDNGGKIKQSRPSSVKAVASLVPPPLPPPPQATGDDFPSPPTYESFPPYAPAPGISVPSRKPMSPTVYSAPNIPSIDNDSNTQIDDDGPVISGYQYEPPAFLPTAPTVNKPESGYSYKNPTSFENGPSMTNIGGYTYNKPTMTMETPPEMDDSPPKDFSFVTDEKPSFHGYHYSKPSDIEHHDHYGHGHGGSSYEHENDFPELVLDKHPDTTDDHNGEKDMKDNDFGMMPPPPPDMESPGKDHGFPADFPSDFDFHHDFDDHDFFHHHHHHPTTTTTTTTTESPRVNRFSYYYLGKKLYYLPLYFSVYFIVYVGALIIKAVLRHKIVYPNSWRPNGTTATFFSKRSADSWNLSNEKLHEITGKVSKAIAEAAEKYITKSSS